MNTLIPLVANNCASRQRKSLHAQRQNARLPNQGENNCLNYCLAIEEKDAQVWC